MWPYIECQPVREQMDISVAQASYGCIQCQYTTIQKTLKFSLGFRGFTRLGSTFIFLQQSKPVHICIHVMSLHIGEGFQQKLR